MSDSATDLSPSIAATLAAVSVDSAIWEHWPDYRVLAIVADRLEFGEGEETVSPLTQAEERIRARGAMDWTTEPHVAAWMAAYAEFGAKPKRTSPSVLALLKRVEVGLPRIDPVTDLYNAVSITHLLPIGGEDLAAYRSAPRLSLATGQESFDTIDSGAAVIDHPVPGEVIWQDDLGVTCRRWNWRQCVRTRISPGTTTAIFLLEALAAMPDEDLIAAGEELIAGLRRLSPGVLIDFRLVASGEPPHQLV